MHTHSDPRRPRQEAAGAGAAGCRFAVGAACDWGLGRARTVVAVGPRDLVTLVIVVVDALLPDLLVTSWVGEEAPGTAVPIARRSRAPVLCLPAATAGIG
jgi:hypothetical protein